jgi:hypothetical protein
MAAPAVLIHVLIELRAQRGYAMHDIPAERGGRGQPPVHAPLGRRRARQALRAADHARGAARLLHRAPATPRHATVYARSSELGR